MATKSVANPVTYSRKGVDNIGRSLNEPIPGTLDYGKWTDMTRYLKHKNTYIDTFVLRDATSVRPIRTIYIFYADTFAF